MFKTDPKLDQNAVIMLVSRAGGDLLLVLLLWVPLRGELHHALDELEDQGRHHLHVDGLAFRVVAVEPGGGKECSC